MASFDEFLATQTLLLFLREDITLIQSAMRPTKIKVREIDSIPKMQRELMNTQDLEKSKDFGIHQNILDIEEEYSLKELKELVLKNNYPIEEVVGHKGRKRTWAKALHKTSEWGLNTFIVGVNKDKKHHLSGQMDVLLMIQDFM